MAFSATHILNSKLNVETVGKYAEEPFSGNSNMTKTFKKTKTGFTIMNSSGSSLFFTIGEDTYEVEPGEIFQENFAPFNTVMISSAGKFRAYGLGNNTNTVVVTPDPAHDTVTYIGRWFNKTIDGVQVPSAMYPGARIAATVNNTSKIIANFKYSNQGFTKVPTIAYRVDGGAWTIKPLADSVTLATGLSTTTHVVEIVYNSNYQYDPIWGSKLTLSFVGFALDTDGIYTSNTDTKKNILFVGDSISLGIKALANNDEPASSSAINSYSFLTGEKLGADVYVAAFGGAGVSKGGSGGAPTVKDYVGFDASGVPSDDLIDTVVMEVGTNDYQYASFKTAYLDLMSRVRELYPTQRVYLMDIATGNDTRKTELTDIAALDGNATFVNTDTWTIETTDGLHPSSIGADVMATKLAEALVADDWANGGGKTVVTPTNLWIAAGKPSGYNPLPTGWPTADTSRLAFDGYTGKTFKVDFKAKSAKLGTLNVYTEYKNDFNKHITLTATLTQYSYTFTDTYTGTGNFFNIMDESAIGDIVISEISIIQV